MDARIVASMNDGLETEVKIRLPNAAGILEKLRSQSFEVAEPRVFEANTLYDTADGKVRAARAILRLRRVGDRCVLTWKGPNVASSYKSRPERETTVASCDVMNEILANLGYRPMFRYEKYRTEFRRAEDTRGVVTVDETPIGDFLELEGAGAWIDATAERLGFSKSDYVLESYGRLYVTECERRGMEPTNMVFASHE